MEITIKTPIKIKRILTNAMNENNLSVLQVLFFDLCYITGKHLFAMLNLR
jgi:hypothetical protein